MYVRPFYRLLIHVSKKAKKVFHSSHYKATIMAIMYRFTNLLGELDESQTSRHIK